MDDTGVCAGLPGAVGRDIKATEGQLRAVFISCWKQVARSSAWLKRNLKRTFRSSVECQWVARGRSRAALFTSLFAGAEKKSHLSFLVREESLIGR